MTIFSVYIINNPGGLTYQYDHNIPRPEVEKTFGFRQEITLEVYNEKIVVAFGERDSIKVGHALLSLNGIPADGKYLQDGHNILDMLDQEENFPIIIKFGRPKFTANERIMLASIFHSLFAIASQLSPEPRSLGIEMLETDTFKLHSMQTLTGLKFIIIASPSSCGCFVKEAL